MCGIETAFPRFASEMNHRNDHALQIQLVEDGCSIVYGLVMVQ
jgi:hypothetical protein